MAMTIIGLPSVEGAWVLDRVCGDREQHRQREDAERVSLHGAVWTESLRAPSIG